MRGAFRFLIAFFVVLLAMSLAGYPQVFSTKLGALARAGLCSRTQWALCSPSSTSKPWLSANTRNRLFHATSIARSASPQFVYRISASYSAKGNSLDPERNLYNHDPLVRTKQTATELKNGKVDKRNRPASGQDAFFVHQVGDTGSVAFGVADGVGGWTESGIDPADFAHGLCDYMAAAANGYPEGFRKGPLRPKDLLQIGYDDVTEDRSILGGGSTACLANADPKGTLEVANLGDSGFIHLGMNAVRYFSPPQTHAFNTPYQLSKIPPKMLAQMRMFGGSMGRAETPKDAEVTQHSVKHGDVLLFATDGVWDNLSPQDVLHSIGRLMTTMGGWVDTKDGFKVSDQLATLTEKGGIGKSANNTLQALVALAITREAKEASHNHKRDGPFAKEVQKFYPQENWHGGKPDDICVVVAIAVEDGLA